MSDVLSQAEVETLLSAMETTAPVRGALARDASEAAAFRPLGVTAFIVSSDQGFMRQSAGKVAADFREMAGSKP